MTGPVWLLARRNLLRNRVRLVASIGGVALALSLVLALNAIVDGVSVQMTTYIDRAGADVWVAQAGVHNLHMAASSMPESVVGAVRDVSGVAQASPILYATETISANDQRQVAYVIGLPTGTTIGLPAMMRHGEAIPGSGEAVVGEDFANLAHVGIGDSVTIFGRDLRIAGISASEANLLNTVAFVSFDDFARAQGLTDVVSFVLVQTAPGASADAVATAIEGSVAGVSALSRPAFAQQERGLVMSMAGDVITMMNAIGFAVGLAVVALTVYVATLSGRREYGLLKALGARGRVLYAVVLAQAGMSVALGFLAALAFTATLALLVPALGLPLTLTIEPASVMAVALVATAIAGVSSVLPVRQVAGIDPAIVFKRGIAL
jgi:putative ABC transport system permease protein